jgi:outer membrane protein OmpA-like peptidoglycan-associated protein
MAKKYILVFIFLVLVVPGFSQTRFTLREADKYYSHYHYASAIPLYELWMNEHPDDNDVQLKLADSYEKINDSERGEVAFRKLLGTPKQSPEVLLSYACMLARNGKYHDALKYFNDFSKQGGDTRGDRYVKAFSNLHKFFRDSSLVKVKPLVINSYQDDFSPVLYKGGLLFCSNRSDKRHVKNTFDWNHSPFLDLYFATDTSFIDHPVGNTAAAKRKKAVIVSSGHSDITYVTSNDTRTLGHSQKPLPTDSLNSKGIVVTRFDHEINSRYHEGPVSFFRGEDSLVFTRNNYSNGKYRTDKTGVNRLKLFIARRKADRWSISDFPYNSDDYSVGHPALAPDNLTLYFVSDMPGGKGGTDIWKSSWKSGKWSQPENIDGINTEGNEMYPFVDANGNIFFASDGWAGLGGLDVFYARSKKDRFDVPRNVGFPINSMKDDFGLILNADGKTGYFSSSRNWKYTRDDIFSFSSATSLIKPFVLQGVAKEEGSGAILEKTSLYLVDEKGNVLATAITPQNGTYNFPIEPEFKYSLKAAKEGYFSFSLDVDTKNIEPGEPLVVDAVLAKKGLYMISCVISDSRTGQMLDSVKYTLKEMRSKKVLVDAGVFSPGTFKINLNEIKKGDVFDLQLQISAKGYLSRTVGYRAVFQEPGELKLHELMDITLEKIDLGVDIGKLLKVKPIYFDLGKAVIRPDAAKELDKIVQVMVENPGMRIELGSHTDARGSDDSNLSLSDRRAKASAAYIVSKGISPERIKGTGYGETKLVNHCTNGVKCKETDHQLNRRTEFIVTSLGE